MKDKNGIELNMTRFELEEWWRHCGCYDREQASRIKYTGQENYLQITDDWWNGLREEQKIDIYEDFFSEC